MYSLIHNAGRGISQYSLPLPGASLPFVTTHRCRNTITHSNIIYSSVVAPELASTRLSGSRYQHFHTAGPRLVGQPYLRQLRARSTPGKFSDTTSNPQGSARSVLRDMQVTRAVFEGYKPRLLENLRRSLFVAIDLEFSGLHKPADGGRHVADRQRGKMSTQEFYTSTREAVETYQLLQVGLCPVEWRAEDETYVASPANIFVSPIVSPPSLGVDRVFSLQSSTLAFLIDHGFDFNTQLRHGISYLSRVEEKKIIDSWTDERKRELVAIDTGSKQFEDDCIKALEEWVSNPDAPWDFLNISTDRGIMSNYQRMIVHQVVRTRFPNLTSQGKGSFVCVTRQTEEQILRKKAESKETFHQQLDSAIGLRHIIDELFEPKRPDGKKIVLVGHNCFMDLLYLYSCFIGKLPEKVEEFVELVSSNFPILIDTKYLATYGDNSATANSGSTLEILKSHLRAMANPKIELCDESNSYGGDGHAYHEAGYDAYATATVLIRVAARLVHEGGWKLTPPQLQLQQSESPSVSTKSVSRDVASEAKDYVPMEVDSELVAVKDHGVGLAEETVLTQLLPSNQKFASFLSLGAEEDAKFHDDVKSIPGFHGDHFKFWEPYANVLRAFNTDDGVLKLPGKRAV